MLWFFLAAVGGLLLLLKEIKLHQQQQKSLLLVDAIFILPVLFIPTLLVRHDFSLVLMLAYAVSFLIAYLKIYKKSK